MKARYSRVVYLVVAIVLFLWALPELIRFGAVHGLTQLSAQVAEIEDVDLNLFTGKASVTGVNVEYDKEPTLTLGRLSVDLDLLALFSKQFLIEKIELIDVSAKVYERAGSWVAVLPIVQSDETQTQQEAASDASWQLGIASMLFSNVKVDVRYEDQAHSINIKELTAGQLFMWEPDQKASLKLNSSINGSPFNLSSDFKPFAQAKSIHLNLALDQLDLKPIHAFLPETIESLSARLSLDTELNLVLAESGDIQLTQQGSVALNLEALKLPDIQTSIEDIRWQGQFDLNLPKAADASVSAHGTLSVDQLKARHQRLELENKLSKLSWAGEVAMSLENLITTLTMTAGLTGSDWQLTDQNMSGDIGKFDTLEIKDIQINGLDKVFLGQVAIGGVASLIEATGVQNEARQPLVALERLTLSSVRIQEQKALALEGIELSSLQIKATRKENGEIAVLDAWLSSLEARTNKLVKGSANDEKTKERQAKANAKAEPIQAVSDAGESENEGQTEPAEFTFRVGRLAMGGDNKLIFQDLAVKPNVTHPLEIKILEVGSIDSNRVELPTSLDLKLGLYEYGYLNLRGELTPLQPRNRMQSELKAEIKGVELNHLSPYLEGLTGYRAESGQVNIDSTLNINQGSLDSETQLKILRLQLAAVDPGLIEQLSQYLAMPIETALSVVTDSDDNLKLTIPVNGDLSEPDIHIDRIISGAVTQAVQNAALTYFKYAVQPFGAVMMVSETIGEMTLKAKFEPVRFIAGSSEIVAEQAGYLEKVAEMIKEKKEFSILVCVMVTDQDFKVRNAPSVPVDGKDDEWGKSLAEDRSDVIKSSLIKEYGLAPDKVQTCQPLIGVGQPRAVLGL